MKKFFNDVTTLDELKAAYRRLAMENHPDRGGSNEIIQAINREHDELFNSLKAEFNKSATVKSTETPEEFRNIIIELLKFDGLIIELCGRWLWIGGNTYAYKAKLKELGCKWAAKKKL